jgi:subtilisin family serine protease
MATTPAPGAHESRVKSRHSWLRERLTPLNVLLLTVASALLIYLVIRFIPRPPAPLPVAPNSASKPDEPPTDGPPIQFVPGECIIQYKPNVTGEEKTAIREKYKAELKQELGSKVHAAGAGAQSGGLELLTLGDIVESGKKSKTEANRAQLAAIEKISEDPHVQFAEPNFIFHKAQERFVSNDPYYVQGKLWGVRTQGIKAAHTSIHVSPTPPKPAASHSAAVDKPLANSFVPPKSARASAAPISSSKSSVPDPLSQYSTHADKAWAAGHVGSKDLYVGVIDSGIQYDHPDLAPNMWNQKGDDFYDSPDEKQLFANNEDPHGTHVAGIIAAVGGNGIGIAGVVWKATLVEAKFLGPDGTGDTAGAVTALKYLTDLKISKKINIVAVNASWTSSAKSKALLNAIKLAGQANILIVAAAGNDHLNSDKYKAYPAGYDPSVDTYDGTPGIAYNNVISVAAIAPDGALAPFSNYGLKTVHLAAPGVGIWSTWPKNDYHIDDGTSMAAPYVTGAVALYASTHPAATAREIRAAILASVTPDSQLQGKVATGGTLNLATF